MSYIFVVTLYLKGLKALSSSRSFGMPGTDKDQVISPYTGAIQRLAIFSLFPQVNSSKAIRQRKSINIDIF